VSRAHCFAIHARVTKFGNNTHCVALNNHDSNDQSLPASVIVHDIVVNESNHIRVVLRVNTRRVCASALTMARARSRYFSTNEFQHDGKYFTRQNYTHLRTIVSNFDVSDF